MIYRGKVLESRALTPTTHMIRVEKAPGFSFRPVQFCGLEIMTREGSEEYSMSLACSPTKPYLEFGARLSASPWKQAFAALGHGEEVEIDGAYGHFVLDETRDAVFVAGGIGITPVKGMAEHLADTRSSKRAVLVYSNRSQEEIAYREELSRLEKENPQFHVIHTLTREPAGSTWSGRRGRIDAQLVQEAAAGLSDPTYYLCGKGEMVMSAGQALVAAGVPRDRIVFEVFRGYT
ncbi:MAG: ferredoxin--NADP reductase [Thermoplasmatota archaeon]